MHITLDTVRQNPRTYFQVISINQPSLTSNFNVVESATCSSIYFCYFGFCTGIHSTIKMPSKIMKISLELKDKNKWNVVCFLNLLLPHTYYGCTNNPIQITTFNLRRYMKQ